MRNLWLIVAGIMLLVGCKDPTDTAQNQCDAAEQTYIKKNQKAINEDTTKCGTENFADQSNIEPCIEKAVGAKNLSDKCADCFAKTAKCVIASCLVPPSGCDRDTCTKCRCIKSTKSASKSADKTPFSLADCSGIQFDPVDCSKCGS